MTLQAPLSFEAYLAYTLTAIVTATATPDETPAQRDLRSAAIAALFAGFAPADPVEALIVSQCITTQFMLDAAHRDLARPGIDPKLQARMRSGAVTMSRLLHMWVSQRDKLRARARPAKQQAAPAPKPASPPERPAATGPMKAALLGGTRSTSVPLPPFLAAANITGATAVPGLTTSRP